MGRVYRSQRRLAGGDRPNRSHNLIGQPGIPSAEFAEWADMAFPGWGRGILIGLLIPV